MIKLITGQPGHRKTVYAIAEALKLKKQGRVVYAHGIKDLDYERIGFLPLHDPTKWEDLPDGSVVIIDECYSTFPNRNPGSKVPPHVDGMARHRHRGFDFILVAQQGIQLDPFLRGLYDSHTHCKKKWGNGPTRLKQWSAYQSNVNGVSADVDTFVPAKELFTYYTSTVMNTSKWNVPNWAKYTAAGVALVLIGVIFVKYRFDDRIEGDSASVPQSGAAAGPTRSDDSQPRTVAEYAQEHLPRFATMPWTAPIYDNRPVVADPEIYCASSDAGLDANGNYAEAGCSCITDQGTRYDLPMAQCRTLAMGGRAYNPYSTRRLQEMQQARGVGAAAPTPMASAAGPAVAAPVRAIATETAYGAPPPPSGTFALDPLSASPGGSP